MENKKKYIILGIVTVLSMVLIVFFVGRSFGFFKYIKKGDITNIITISGIKTEITNPENDALNLEETYPITDDEALSQTPFVFTMTNTSKKTLTYTMRVTNDEKKQLSCALEDQTICPKLTTDYIKFAYKKNDGTYTEPQLLSANDDIIASGTIAGGETITSSIIIWIDSEAGNEIMGHYFFGQLIISGELQTEPKFKDTILANNKVIEKTPTLTNSSNNTSDESGLYMSTATNDGSPTYYFRGDVENNYVEFAEQTWRIVRINEDGTVRLIMSEGINDNSTYAFNATNYNTYEYMYYSNSEIKNTLEAWYQTNIVDIGYSSSVVTGEYFCEEARVKSSTSYTTGNATMKLYNDTTYVPSFNCSEDGNGKGVVNENVGLLTYDEILHAGSYYNQTNNDYYLYNKSGFWTMSPVGVGTTNNSRAWDINSSGGLGDNNVTNARILRPVINLKSDTVVSGTGTSDDPYRIKIKFNDVLTTGQSVTAIDGSKWHVLEDSGSDNEYVTLLSDYNLNSDGSYNTTCGRDINSTYTCSTMAFDSDNTNAYNEDDSNNIGYFIKNTYKPIVTTILPGTTDVTLPTAYQIGAAMNIDFKNEQTDYSISSSWATTTIYWTKTAYPLETFVWNVRGSFPDISRRVANDSNMAGARPVITTLKTNLKLN